jgi:SulP family sulfate permease
MNVELIAHGYSNIISGLAGGLQNYMAYTQSVIYAKSGGTGKVSGIVVAIVTLILFVIGPTLASYIPRCMAGTLLLHVGIDLFLEGVYDSFHRFDWLEYTSVWLM